jgi:hypothetical protein
MIEINLLPQELKKKRDIFLKLDLKRVDIKRVPLLKLTAGVLVLLVLTQIILLLAGTLLNTQLSSAIKTYESLLPQKREADALKAKVSGINKRSCAIDELIVKRFSWARKINNLSDCMTQGIWLSELYYDERPIPGSAKTVMPGALVISGYAVGAGEEGTALIGGFIKGLQDNKDLYSDFTSINLLSTKSETVDKHDVVSFKLSCVFK